VFFLVNVEFKKAQWAIKQQPGSIQAGVSDIIENRNCHPIGYELGQSQSQELQLQPHSWIRISRSSTSADSEAEDDERTINH